MHIKMARAITRDSVRVRIPRSIIPVLTHFFDHVSDAMNGDDRPDHGLAMMRQNREYCRMPFLILRMVLKRAEKRLTKSQRQRGFDLLQKLMDSENAWGEEIRKRVQESRKDI
jgi:hypothetical protein